MWECSEKGGRWAVGPEECVFCVLMAMNYTDMGEQRSDGEPDGEQSPVMLGPGLGAVSNGCKAGTVGVGMKGRTCLGEERSKIKSSGHVSAVALVSSLTALVVHTGHASDQTSQQSSTVGVGLTGPTLVEKQSWLLWRGESFFFGG